ncbi:MAG: hypothetical protein K6E35_08170 [Bacteroidales bacterium]|nr:hypothetical protein [Bacteroidales bacterium]
MKKICILSLLAAFAFVGCQRGASGSADVRTFGMTGPVKEVFQAVTLISEDGVEQEAAPVAETLLMSFDEQGRVTLDLFGNVYVYDEAGNFVQGNHEITVMERDPKGRILTYDSTRVPDDMDYDGFSLEQFFCVTFGYDGKNRPVLEDHGGWEWETVIDRNFQGNKVYPESERFSGGFEDVVEEGTIHYEYTAFDDRGNWTERTVTKVTVTTEDLWEEKTEQQTETLVTRERRTIHYWSGTK